MPVRSENVAKGLLKLRPQAREHSPEYLRRLADSLLQRWLQPIGALRDYTVVWGTGRVLAALMEPKITHVPAVILDEEISESAFLRLRAVENFVRNDLTNIEKCRIAVEYAKSEASSPLKKVAADLGVDPSMLTRWLSYDKCIDLVQQALSCDSITLNAMYSLSQLPIDQQEAALAKLLNPKKEPSKGNGVRVPKIKIPLANDNATGVVTVAGEGIDWDDTENLLKEALKAVRAARDKNLDTKTAQSVWRDMAAS